MRYPALPSGLRKLLASDRLRHVAIAAVIAVVVAMSTVLRPLDITIWSLQSKMFDVQPSGDIVLVEVEQGGKSNRIAEDNARMISALQSLDAAGAARIFVDIPLLRSRSPETDAALRGKLVKLREKVVLTRTFNDYWIEPAVRGSDPMFEQGMLVASNDLKPDFLGYVWELSPTANDRASTAALWTYLSGTGASNSVFPDYSIRYQDPIKFSQSDYEEERGSFYRRVAGSDVLVVSNANTIRIPDKGLTSPTLAHLVASETSKKGRGTGLGWPLLLALLVCLAISAALHEHNKLIQRLSSTTTVLIISASLFVAPYFGVRVVTSCALLFLAIIVSFRVLSLFKRRHLHLEARSRLPNFAAFHRDFNDIIKAQDTIIVVVKVARMDAVFSMLNLVEQARFLRQLGIRLALGDKKKVIYYDGGKYFAFGLSRKMYKNPSEHLEGLRAIVSQTIAVGDRNYDVSITVGADTSYSNETPNRLNSAVAAADQAREAYRPVFIISDFAADSEEWDYSLQSRLETALSEDRISIKLQPQIDLQSGSIVGAESLARWVDEKHGEISPARFILQCERVGRLDDLTKRVFFKTLKAAEQLKRHDMAPRISLNVSAVQFVDSRIADLIAAQIEQSGADPTLLTIEVTETARIDNFSIARDVIEQIKRSGAQFSLDDFGIASANYDALFELPFDEVKIDRLFVKHARGSMRARAVVGSIVKMARDAGIVSVAEGIEDLKTLETMRDMDCQLAQGYFIAEPLSVPDFERTLILQRVNDRKAISEK